MPTVLIFGRTGQLARELVRASWPAGTTLACHGRAEVDLADAAAVRRLIASRAPALVINAAAYTAVDRAESEPAAAFRLNRDAVAELAAACAAAALPLIHVSTDYVFDGEASAPYDEDAPPAPLGVYGESKHAGEAALRHRHAAHVILRTGGVFSPFPGNLVRRVLERAAAGAPLAGLSDRWFCPTSAGAVARAIAAIAARIGTGGHAWGTYHFCGQPPATACDFITEIVRLGAAAGITPPRPVAAVPAAAWHEAARRPRRAILDCRRIESAWGIAPPSWRAELAAVIDEIAAAAPAPALRAD